MKYSFLVLIVFMAMACATAARLQRVSVGMTKAQVLDQMGDPDGVKGNGQSEVLVYSLKQSLWVDRWDEYWVKLIDGKVYSYGRPQDVGQPVPTHMVLDHNITVNEK